MKLILAMTHDRDKNRLADSLLEQGFSFTKLGSTGGFLRQGNTTMMIGVEDHQVDHVLQILRTVCGVSERFVNIPEESIALSAVLSGSYLPHPMKTESGGGVAFVIPVESFHTF
jgi:uncharacterized protein YaaQ